MKKLLTLLFASLVAFSLTAPTFADQTTKTKLKTGNTYTKKTLKTVETPPQSKLKTGKSSTKKTLKTLTDQVPPSRQGSRL